MRCNYISSPSHNTESVSQLPVNLAEGKTSHKIIKLPQAPWPARVTAAKTEIKIFTRAKLAERPHPAWQQLTSPLPQPMNLAMSICVTLSSCAPCCPLGGLSFRGKGWEGRENSQETSLIHRTWGFTSSSAHRTTFFFFCYLLAS